MNSKKCKFDNSSLKIPVLVSVNSEKYIGFDDSSIIHELWKSLHFVVKIPWKCHFWMIWTQKKPVWSCCNFPKMLLLLNIKTFQRYKLDTLNCLGDLKPLFYFGNVIAYNLHMTFNCWSQCWVIQLGLNKFAFSCLNYYVTLSEFILWSCLINRSINFLWSCSIVGPVRIAPKNIKMFDCIWH